jgi:hypothetical protein
MSVFPRNSANWRLLLQLNRESNHRFVRRTVDKASSFETVTIREMKLFRGVDQTRHAAFSLDAVFGWMTFQKRRAVIDTNLVVGEPDHRLMIVSRFDKRHSGIHDSPQRLNLEWSLSARGKLPIGHQLVLVDFDPCKNQAYFSWRKAAFKYLTFGNRDYRLMVWYFAWM